jgi:hypothetical protein
MNEIDNILIQLKELKSSLQADINYEESKENYDMCKLLTTDLLKVMKAINALED